MDINNKAEKASQWSLITELLSKVVSPITNMILARLLTPEAFGMIATITMITSFADIFSDAGFQKYLVQEEYNSKKDLNDSTNVAFWTNLAISVFLWIIIFAFKDDLAHIVGNDGLGLAISIASLSLPLTSFSSIQIARFRRSFDFKTLFFARLVGILVPLFVTIPLAFVLRSFWAMIIGTITTNLVNAIVLTVKSEWKPRFFYNLKQLNRMLKFSLWTMLEQLLGWANLNIGVFLVGVYLSSYYLGIYKTSMATTNQIMSIIVNAFSPVLLASLSRLKSSETEYIDFFYKFEEKIALVILPIGIGIYVYRDLFTYIVLGSQWNDAVGFIGLWALLRGLFIVYGMFSMEVFVSLGKPQISVLAQVLELSVLIPTILYSASFGYDVLYVSRTLVVIWLIVVELTLLQKFSPINSIRIFTTTVPYLLVSLAMGLLGVIFTTYINNYVLLLFTIVICMIFYFSVLYMIPKSRECLIDLLFMFKMKKKKS